MPGTVSISEFRLLFAGKAAICARVTLLTETGVPLTPTREVTCALAIVLSSPSAKLIVRIWSDATVTWHQLLGDAWIRRRNVVEPNGTCGRA